MTENQKNKTAVADNSLSAELSENREHHNIMAGEEKILCNNPCKGKCKCVHTINEEKINNRKLQTNS